MAGNTPVADKDIQEKRVLVFLIYRAGFVNHESTHECPRSESREPGKEVEARAIHGVTTGQTDRAQLDTFN